MLNVECEVIFSSHCIRSMKRKMVDEIHRKDGLRKPQQVNNPDDQHESVHCRGNMINYRLGIVCGSASESCIIAETGHWRKVSPFCCSTCTYLLTYSMEQSPS